MNKIIKQQLEKIQLADITNYDPETNTYHIPKRTTIKLEEDEYYLLTLQPEFLNDTIIRDNWNKGSVPPALSFKAEVEKTLGRMVKIDSIIVDEEGNDTDKFWSGWISTDYIAKGVKI